VPVNKLILFNRLDEEYISECIGLIGSNLLGGGSKLIKGFHKMDKKILIFTLFAIVFLGKFSFAGEVKTEIYVKNIKEISTGIREVKAWGLIDSLYRTINYKIIDSIKTSDETIVRQIAEIHNEIRVERRTEYFLLDLTSVVIPPLKRRNVTPFLVKESILLDLSTENSSRYGFQYNYYLNPLKFMLHRFSFAFNSFENDQQITAFNFQYGLGMHYNYEKFRIQFLLNYSSKLFALRDGDIGRNRKENFLFLNLSLQRVLDKREIFIASIG
jgi:hypothetical protein